MTALHPLDDATLAAAPLRPNLWTGLPDVAVGCKDFVAAANGLFVRTATPALRVCLPVARASLPYAPMKGSIVPANGPVPRALLDQFMTWAADCPDLEIAAVIETHGAGYRLRRLDHDSNGAAHVSYDDRQVNDDALVFDLHSHGQLPGFFSAQDDQSDLSRRGPYLAGVVGHCGVTNDLALRLVLPPYLHTVTVGDLIAHGVIA